MFGIRTLPNNSKTEAEKPFWISYADLMTALMTLFLVVMVASLISVTKKITQDNQGEKERKKDIAKMCSTLKIKAARINKVITVDCHENRIDFGSAGKFDKDGFKLKESGTQALSDVVPLILDIAKSPEGEKWFKQVLIEGFTDTDGSYLYNLHLSLLRSEAVMCTLLSENNPVSLNTAQKEDVTKLFLAGGVSFNNPLDSKYLSRRVELKLQFYGLKEKLGKEKATAPEFHITKPEICRI